MNPGAYPIPHPGSFTLSLGSEVSAWHSPFEIGKDVPEGDLAGIGETFSPTAPRLSLTELPLRRQLGRGSPIASRLPRPFQFLACEDVINLRGHSLAPFGVVNARLGRCDIGMEPFRGSGNFIRGPEYSSEREKAHE